MIKIYIYYIILITICIAGWIIFSPAESYAAFSFYRTITIDHTKVPNTDQTDFPVLVSGTYSYLATTGNGGKVQNASGYDVGFYTNSDCSTGKMAWETETYTAASGLVNYWIKVSSLSHTTDNVFYMCYGDASISTDQSNKTGVWNSGYQLVWHFPDGTTLSSLDSTSNGRNGTRNNTPTATTGKIGGGINYTKSSSQYTNSADYTLGTSFTVEAWAKGTSNIGSYSAVLESNYINGYYLGSNGGNQWQFIVNGNFFLPGGGITISTTGYHYVVGTYAPTTMTFYLDGDSQGTNSGSNPSSTKGTFNGGGAGSGSGFWDGGIDEVRISNVVRGADWIKTAYNNISSPSTFYAVGDETSLGGGGGGSSTSDPHIFKLNNVIMTLKDAIMIIK